MAELEKTIFSDEVSLKEIIVKGKHTLKHIYSKWYIIIVAIIIGAGAGYLYTAKKKVLFTAVCTFVVEGSHADSPVTGLAALISGGSGSGGEGLFKGNTLLSLYTTRLMLEKTLFSTVSVDGENVLLLDYYLRINELGDSWSKIPGANKSALLAAIISNVKSEYVEVKSEDFIRVSVKSPNELFSKYFLEELIQTVNDFYVQTKTKKSLTTVRILQKQADSLRFVLGRSMTGAAMAAEAYPNANPALKVLAVPAQKKAIDVQATTSLYSGVVASLETSKLELRKETPLIQIIDRPVLPLVNDEPSKIKASVAGGVAGAILAITLTLMNLLYKKVIENEPT